MNVLHFDVGGEVVKGRDGMVVGVFGLRFKQVRSKKSVRTNMSQEFLPGLGLQELHPERTTTILGLQHSRQTHSGLSMSRGAFERSDVHSDIMIFFTRAFHLIGHRTTSLEVQNWQIPDFVLQFTTLSKRNRHCPCADI